MSEVSVTKYRQSRVSQRLQPYTIVRLYLPHSEVCIHMKVAGTVMLGQIVGQYHSVQLYDLSGQPFSGPITYGEAGIFRDDEGFYYYPPEEVT